MIRSGASTAVTVVLVLLPVFEATALEQARGIARSPTADHTESHQSFGWRFMEKFIQLPFVIPHLDEETAKRFAADRLGGLLVDHDAGKQAEESP